jgi:hypothetical protein
MIVDRYLLHNEVTVHDLSGGVRLGRVRQLRWADLELVRRTVVHVMDTDAVRAVTADTCR